PPDPVANAPALDPTARQLTRDLSCFCIRERIGDGRRRPGLQSSSSTRCAQVTARAPSPTAKATRLVVLLRTSPAAKTPGHVVSTVQGSRSERGQRPDR